MVWSYRDTSYREKVSQIFSLFVCVPRFRGCFLTIFLYFPFLLQITFTTDSFTYVCPKRKSNLSLFFYFNPFLYISFSFHFLPSLFFYLFILYDLDQFWSDCGACPRGFRANASSICVPCDDEPMLYDWLYLGFMALVALVLHWFCIDMVSNQRNIPKKVIALHLSALLEVVSASLIIGRLLFYEVVRFSV